MKKKSLSWRVRLAFGAAIFALLIVGAISYRGMAASTESGEWVGHTHEVLEDLQDLLALAGVDGFQLGALATVRPMVLDQDRGGV